MVDGVHHLAVQQALSLHQLQIVQPAVQIFAAEIAACADLICHRPPEAIYHSLHLLAVLGAHFVLNEHLAGRFVFAVADQLNLNAQLVQKVLDEYSLGADTHHHSLAVGVHNHLVGHGCQVVREHSVILCISHDGLAAGAETGQCGAEFLCVGCGELQIVGVQINELDGGICGGCVNGADRVQEGNPGACGTAHKSICREILYCALADNGALVYPEHGTGFGSGAALHRSAGSAAYHSEEDKHRYQHCDKASQKGAQNYFPKGFHLYRVKY